MHEVDLLGTVNVEQYDLDPARAPRRTPSLGGPVCGHLSIVSGCGVHIHEHPATGPWHSLPVLMSFHRQLGHEIARMIEDHPEALEYWCGE